MKFYNIKDDYILFLRSYDSKVAENKHESRPYIGVVIEVGEIKYCAPFTSPKPKHQRMKNSKDFRKINQGQYGAINFNNMIPVPDSALLLKDIANEPDQQYRRLLQNQYNAIKADSIAIEKTAENLRNLVLTNDADLRTHDKQVKSRCYDLALLESIYMQYGQPKPSDDSKDGEPMKYKFVAVDMDGTLLNDVDEITPLTMKTIQESVSQGLIFSVCTGRPIQGVAKYRELMELNAPVITYNGAMIVMSDTREVIFQQNLEREDARRILKLGREYGTTMCVWSGNQLYGNVLNERIHEYKKATGVEPLLIQDEDALLDQGITKILWYDEVEKIGQMEKEIPPSAFQSVTFCTSKPFYLEFFNSKVSKASAMEKIGELYHISREEMIAIGDGFNDLSMINYAGLGVAMKNAPQGVKAQADYITRHSNQEDGIAEVLRKFVLPCPL